MYYVASTKIKERLGPIAQELQSYDVVGLQEVSVFPSAQLMMVYCNSNLDSLWFKS